MQRSMIPKKLHMFVLILTATRQVAMGWLLRLCRLSPLHDPMPAQQLADHEMADVLVRPVTQMAGNRGEQVDVESTFLDSVIHTSVRIETTHFRLFSAELLASLFRLVLLIRICVRCLRLLDLAVLLVSSVERLNLLINQSWGDAGPSRWPQARRWRVSLALLRLPWRSWYLLLAVEPWID